MQRKKNTLHFWLMMKYESGVWVAMLRYVYEKFNIYIYAVIPTLFVAGYLVLNNKYGLHLQVMNNHKLLLGCFTFILLLSSLFLMKSLHDDGKYRRLMRKYKHDEIIWRTSLIGLVASLLFIGVHIISLYDFY